ncbi:MAG: heavy metal translocating P-type ATPase [Anaerolineaceae bacterium]|nr:heavy metal translocating P-type ATPase [Anaerolineaceae bacterium]
MINQPAKNNKTPVVEAESSVCNGNCAAPIRPYAPSDNRAEKASVLDFKGFWRYFVRMPDLKIIVPGWILLLGTILLGRLDINPTLLLILQLSVLPVAGWMIFRNGAISLFKEHDLNMNVLMSIASIGAVAIGEAHEALIMVILFTLSEALEGYTNDHARAILTEFADLAPHEALLVAGDGEKLVPIETLQVGDRILVRAGERFPMDGLVAKGNSEVNQAPITGESRLVPKGVGDEVLSGSVNGQGVLEVQVSRLAADNTIQRIIALVTDAQENKAKQEKFIDRFARVYTPIVMAISVLVAVIPTLVFKQNFWNTPETYGWFHRALSVLMVGCPCALIISTPITMVSGLTRAARAGVIFKGGIFLESLSDSKVMAFDKTGTLTLGKPTVTKVEATYCTGNDHCEPCNDLVAIASSLEAHSTHPLGAAVLQEAVARGVHNRYPAAEGLQVLEGRGQQGVLNGKLATVGSLPLFLAEHETPEKIVEEVEEAEERGQTTMLICDGERVVGYLAVQDEPRPEAREVIAELKAEGIRTLMLTGDKSGVADSIAEKVGIDNVFAGLLPAEKLNKLIELKNEFGQVVMVGDGINDSPALAQADIGVAMGGAGNAQVLETADVVLMNDDLSRLPFAVRLSRRVNRLIRQNVVISLAVKVTVAVAAMAGLTPLWVAIFADIGISLIVTLNGLRALRFEAETA